MFKKYKTQLYNIGSVVGGSLFIWQIIKANKALVSEHLLAVVLNFSIILALFGFLVLNLVLAINWKVILDSIGYHLNLLNIITGYFVSFLPRYIPGSIWGYLSRSEWFYRDKKIPHSMTYLCSIIEVFVYLSVPILLLGEFFVFKKVTGIYSFIGLIIWWGLIRLIIKRIKLPNSVRINDFSRILSNLNFGKASLIASIATLYWILSGFVITLLGVLLFPYAINFSKWPLLTLAYSIAWVIGFLAPFIPAGMGVREIVLVQLLTNFVGLTQNQALIYSVVARVLTLTSEAIWVILGLVAKKYY